MNVEDCAIYMLLLYARQLNDHDQQTRWKMLMSKEMRRRRCNRLSRGSLLLPSQSPWVKLISASDQGSFITMTSLDYASFRILVSFFAPTYYANSPYGGNGNIRSIGNGEEATRGRPRLLDAEGCLGLVLCWYRSRGNQNLLHGFFGLTGSVGRIFLTFGRKVLVLIFETHLRYALPTKPDEHKSQEYKDAVHRQYPLLTDVGLVADGLKLQVQQSRDYFVQKRFYNSWKADTFVSNIFVFAPDGRIVICALNAPGVLHDSKLADYGGVYRKLNKLYERYSIKCVIDSAFCTANNPCLIKSSQTDPTGAHELLTNNEATSLRQSSEWGMRIMQATNPKLKDRLPFNEFASRSDILTLAVYLFNFRTEHVGHNQITNVFMPEFSAESHLFAQGWM
mmetsp:Transcript_26532/g.41156  ORF Transcript_26532/g.41156 Transcript_26532/m.41156 type:complete len:394 (-) Transcript_26532:56-1237(-)